MICYPPSVWLPSPRIHNHLSVPQTKPDADEMKGFSGMYLLCGKAAAFTYCRLFLLSDSSGQSCLCIQTISPLVFANTSLYLEVFYKILKPKLGKKSIPRRVVHQILGMETVLNFPPSVSCQSTLSPPQRGIKEPSSMISLPFPSWSFGLLIS